MQHAQITQINFIVFDKNLETGLLSYDIHSNN